VGWNAILQVHHHLIQFTLQHLTSVCPQIFIVHALFSSTLPYNSAQTSLLHPLWYILAATMLGAQSIQLGLNDVVVVGGMESMSNAPYYLPKARQGYRLGHGEVVDGMMKDGLWDVYNDVGMGICAEICADNHSISREAQVHLVPLP
jgi:hypothetical protein